MDDRHENADGGVTCVEAHTDTERALLEIWSAVLEIDGIRVDDDFLALGGDSLSAMRCINRIRSVSGVELSLEAFLVEPAHIVGLARLLDQIRCEAARGSA